MKKLLLIRHAKSSWEYDIQDIDRPLSTRGLSDANLLSNEFIKYAFLPDAVFSSPAKRALSTCKIFMKNLNYDESKLTITDKLYDFGGNQVAKFIHDLDDRVENVMIFGHNHAFTAIANNFGSEYIDNVPTCGLVKLQFENVTWKEVSKGTTELTLFPRDLKS